MNKKVILLLISLSVLNGCNQKEQAPPSQPGKEQDSGGPKIKQQGAASWYGGDFHGKKTASGETYDQNQLTAASKTLPLGTVAQVTNPETGKSVEVKINDRGPFVGNRVMDLSKAAAKKIGIKDKGVSHVKIVAKKPVGKKHKAKSKKRR